MYRLFHKESWHSSLESLSLSRDFLAVAFHSGSKKSYERAGDSIICCHELKRKGLDTVSMTQPYGDSNRESSECLEFLRRYVVELTLSQFEQGDLSSVIF